MLTHALTRTPPPNFADGLTTQSALGKPDAVKTFQQYDAYLNALRECGLSVTTLSSDARFPDSHFIEDTIVVYRDLAFICRQGAAARRGESESIAPHFQDKHCVFMHGDDAVLEGGDVLFCADNRVLIGLSRRTNRAGAEQLRAALLGADSTLQVAFVPLEGVLHLTTGMTELAPGVLVKAPQMLTDFVPDFADVITLPPEEGYAANLLPVNDTLILPAGFPFVRELVENHYTKIIAVEMSEFRKMDGGLTCLSLRY